MHSNFVLQKVTKRRSFPNKLQKVLTLFLNWISYKLEGLLIYKLERLNKYSKHITINGENHGNNPWVVIDMERIMVAIIGWLLILFLVDLFLDH